jgi:hypothetical protein
MGIAHSGEARRVYRKWIGITITWGLSSSSFPSRHCSVPVAQKPFGGEEFAGMQSGYRSGQGRK